MDARSIESIRLYVRELYAQAGRLREFAHITRVADSAKPSQEDELTALLHDILEDGLIVTVRDLEWVMTRNGISSDVTPRISQAVQLLTRFDNSPAGYAQYIRKIVDSRNPIAIRVKTLDIFDHLNPYHRHTLKKTHAARYLIALEDLILLSFEDADNGD